MAATRLLDFLELRPANVSDALELSAEAGWNQTANDWRLMLTEGHGIGITAQGRLVASGIALPMGPRFGWISMVLVTAAFRRRGLATRIMERAVSWLEGRGLSPVLDATPEGASVYGRMGFEGVAALTRWQLKAAADGRAAAGQSSLERIGPEALAQLAVYDAEVSGLQRKPILAHLLDRGPAFAVPDRRGFVLSRGGRLATQIGPVSARDDAMAITLVDAAMAAVQGPVFIDAFDAQTAFSAHLRDRGFTVQRPFIRMVRGDRSGFPSSAQAFAAAGPELG